MPLLRTWQDSLRTGNATIDSQHESICDELDELEAADVLSDSRITQALIVLRAHFTTHFADEEALMERVGFPERESHRLDHIRFFDVWLHFAARITLGGEPELREFTQRLRSWIQEHVLQDDCRLANWIKGVPSDNC